MAQPPKYTRNYDFADFQSSNPTTPLPSAQVESELNEIKATTDAIIDNLALIQRDDTKLANSSVHLDALETAVKDLMVSDAFLLRGEWADMTVYAVGDLVVDSGVSYLCYIAHTSSGSIDTSKFSALTSPVVTPEDPGDDDKFLRASGGVGGWVDLLAEHLTDVVAGLQSVITAADVGAARTALGITATGDSVATAASAAAARTALGASTIGSTIFTAADAAAVIAALAVPALASANTFTADQTIQDADAGATEGPLLILDRNSATPEDNDLVGAVEFRGRSDLPSTRTMAKVLAQALDVSDGNEDAILDLQTIVAGTLTSRMQIGAGVMVGSPTGGDKGAGALNVESLFVNNTEITAGGGLELIASGTLSSVGQLDLAFTPSEWRRVILRLKRVRPATSTDVPWIRTSTNAGSSFDASASNYLHQTIGGITTTVNSQGDTKLVIGFSTANGDGAGESDFEVEVTNPSFVGDYGFLMWRGWNGGPSNKEFVVGGGIRDAAADIDAVRFMYSSGNIAEGTYEILGEPA